MALHEPFMLTVTNTDAQRLAERRTVPARSSQKLCAPPFGSSNRNDVQQRSQSSVHGVGISERLCHIWIEDNHVGARAVPRHIFPADATTEIVLGSEGVSIYRTLSLLLHRLAFRDAWHVAR